MDENIDPASHGHLPDPRIEAVLKQIQTDTGMAFARLELALLENRHGPRAYVMVQIERTLELAERVQYDLRQLLQEISGE